MAAWNRNPKSPKQGYRNVSNFRRDCQKAIAKLLEPVSPDGPLDQREGRRRRATAKHRQAGSPSRLPPRP